MSESVPPTIRRKLAPGRDREAFTLVELLLACAVFAVMLVLMAVAIGQMSTGIRTSSAKVEAFASAREGFANVTRLLGTATLNTYWDYFDASHANVGANANFVPAYYGRQSDLQFVINDQSANANGGNLAGATTGTLTMATHAVFFQSPLGYTTNGTVTNPPGTLNQCGFFLAYGNDPTQVGFASWGTSSPTTIANRARFRLYQWIRNADDGTGINTSTGIMNANAWNKPSWYSQIAPLAENVVAFVLRIPTTANPTTATDYWWNSRTNWSSGSQPNQMNELPPFVEVTMVAVDETAVNRLMGNGASASTPTAAASMLGIQNYSTLFTLANSYTNDLATVTAGLTSKKIPYRVFVTTVPLPGSKWSP
jgi:uncharacterized protein (TIGR02599 family)